MGDVAELENRITAALDRIGAGLSALGGQGSGTDGNETSVLQEKLDAEKTANSQLEERVSAIKEKQEKLVAGLEGEVSKLRGQLAGYDETVQRVKQANQQLRENNQALREANQQGLGDAGLINTGMVAELDALRVSRDTDRAELDAILSDLKPLVEGGANA